MKIRGFIAAPLLGTLIFLVCILIIININRSETAGVSEAVSEAYHNRLVSLVEIYRSDLGSIFNIGLQRNIEYALTSQCWSNFVSIATESALTPGYNPVFYYHSTNPSYLDSNYDAKVDESEERMFICARSAELMKQVVCSKNTTYLFGLPAWANILAEETSFEGISLKVANAEAFKRLIGYEELDLNGTDLCTTLVSGVELDCKDFAQNGALQNYEYKCCSAFDSSGNCAAPVSGCESGQQYFLKIAIQNPGVFPNFPRILAEDSAGNKIRSGAITDRDYNAPVSYPFFKYLNTAFKFNRFLAYGANQQKDLTEIGALRGVAEGSCIGENPGKGCESLNYPPAINFGPPPIADRQDAKKQYSLTYATEVIKKACALAESENLKAEFQIVTANGVEWKECSDLISAAESDDVINSLGVRDVECDANANAPLYCAHLDKISFGIRFVDQDTAAQISPTQKNLFCWYTRSAYYIPS